MHATAGRQPPCVRDAKGVCGEREERVDRGEIQSGEGGGGGGRGWKWARARTRANEWRGDVRRG